MRKVSLPQPTREPEAPASSQHYRPWLVLNSFQRSGAAKCVEHYLTTPGGAQPLHPIPSWIRPLLRNHLGSSPDEGYEATSDPLLILPVPRKLSGEELLLVQETPYQKRHRRREREKPPVRTDRQWGADKVQQRARVHGMPHDRVRPGGDDLLVFRDFDRRRGVSVLPVDEEDEVEPCQNEQVSSDDDAGRHV